MKLEFDNVTKSFGDNLVLDSISLTAEAVQAVVFLGPSGGGKSTLLRIIAGLEQVDAGNIRIDGNSIPTSKDELVTHRKSIGTVFQSFNLFPHLTALENITLPLTKVHGMETSQANQCGLEVLSRFKLEEHSHKKPAHLSGGQNQRVAIARAVAIKPKWLVLDEPTSALDPEMVAEVLDMIADLKDQGLKMFVSTHQMGFANHVADYVGILAKGTFIEFGKASDVFDNPKSQEVKTFLNRILKY